MVTTNVALISKLECKLNQSQYQYFFFHTQHVVLSSALLKLSYQSSICIKSKANFCLVCGGYEPSFEVSINMILSQFHIKLILGCGLHTKKPTRLLYKKIMNLFYSFFNEIFCNLLLKIHIVAPIDHMFCVNHC